VIGSALQLLIQLPVVLRVAPDLRFALDTASEHVRTVARNFMPAFVSRGVVQASAYIDAFIASWLPTGAVTGLGNAQLLYTLPVSLFGMSVAAAELPAMRGRRVRFHVHRCPAAAARRGTSADRVFRRAVGDGLPRARRHRRRHGVADRPLPA
jgi:peptidoglycan biosynthesis protein MviN/MurJ (putative lipid II flippase)